MVLFFMVPKHDWLLGDFYSLAIIQTLKMDVIYNHVYFIATLDAAEWGAELSLGEREKDIYLVEPTGEFENDPNLKA